MTLNRQESQQETQTDGETHSGGSNSISEATELSLSGLHLYKP